MAIPLVEDLQVAFDLPAIVPPGRPAHLQHGHPVIVELQPAGHLLHVPEMALRCIRSHSIVALDGSRQELRCPKGFPCECEANLPILQLVEITDQ